MVPAVRPPSTTKVVPVVYEDSSEARKTTVAAISSDEPMRPSGAFGIGAARRFAMLVPYDSARSGVAMAPGHTAFTRIREDPRSSAATLVIPTTACLVAV